MSTGGIGISMYLEWTVIRFVKSYMNTSQKEDMTSFYRLGDGRTCHKA